MPSSARTILHLDMDAFYAAIEQRDRPALRGRPVIVGAAPDRRGVVATASYEARRFGVHSAMPSRTAGRLCPQAVFLPPRMARYKDVSRRLMRLLEAFTPWVEPVSIDEAFLDVSGVLRQWPDVTALARALKERIRVELELTASVGVATNKFLAKLASDLHKPDGLTVLPREPEAVRAFLAPLPVEKIWGIGDVTARHLRRHAITTIGQIQALTPADLEGLLGAALATHVGPLAHGLDDRPVALEGEEKSLSHETTFDTDCGSAEQLRQTLLELTERVGARLRRAGKGARTTQLKLRFSDFTTLTRRLTLRAPIASDRELWRCARTLWEREAVRRPIRLIGFGVGQLETLERDTACDELPLEFFRTASDADRDKQRQLDRAVDAVRRRFGRQALRRGAWQADDKEERG